MTDDPRLDEFVAAKVEAAYVAMDRRLHQVILPQFREERAGAYYSSATIDGEVEIFRATLEEKVELRIAVEIEGHGRLGLAIDEERSKRIIRELSDVVSNMCAWALSGPSLPREGSEGEIEARRARLAGEMQAHLKARVREAVAETGLPAAPRLPTLTINVNAPNYGIVAGQIQSLAVGASDSVREYRETLDALLRATAKLEETDAAEAREIISALVEEGKRPPEAPKGLVRASLGRLWQIFERANTLGDVSDHLPKVIALLDFVQRALGAP